MNLLLALWYGDGKADDDDDDDDGVILLPAIISTSTCLSDAHIPPPTKNIDQKKEKEKLIRATQTINARIRSRIFFSYLQNTQTTRELSEKKAKKKKINERGESRGREKRREGDGEKR
jgi:hypothetical protein